MRGSSSPTWRNCRSSSATSRRCPTCTPESARPWARSFPPGARLSPRRSAWTSDAAYTPCGFPSRRSSFPTALHACAPRSSGQSRWDSTSTARPVRAAKPARRLRGALRKSFASIQRSRRCSAITRRSGCGRWAPSAAAITSSSFASTRAGILWVMLHSGSRGIGNCIGRYFIAAARGEAQKRDVHLPDRDLAWLGEGSKLFDDYVEAVSWAQDYAFANRREMMELILGALRRELPPFEVTGEAINCHHNYVQQEKHFGERVYVTRKGAISAREGELGIIPGSMGARSYIVRGKGNPESFCSCAHGAGRRMSRSEAKRRFSRADLVEQTQGVECRKDKGVLDEIPGAYKDIDLVMADQTDLVEVVHTLKQVVCIKG